MDKDLIIIKEQRIREVIEYLKLTNNHDYKRVVEDLWNTLTVLQHKLLESEAVNEQKSSNKKHSR